MIAFSACGKLLERVGRRDSPQARDVNLVFMRGCDTRANLHETAPQDVQSPWKR
jgi:hypothetical protein